ncbi:MAG: PEP/pyruvate-binding domain-containing protein, partial [Anaerolineae bacterium]
MRYIKPFLELGPDDVALAGGKAVSLGDLTRAGFPVPPGFCVTTDAYRAFVAANDLRAEILRLSGAVKADDPESLETASAQIRALFAAGQIPDPLAAEIRRAYLQLINPQSAVRNPQSPVAVRSSATAEDLPGASFAGQQETFLNVLGAEAVLAAVQQCWASLWTARAIGYRLREGIPPEEVALAAVVQQLVPAEMAGILFTANPVTGARDEAVINAAWGLGEAVVGGLVTPDHVVADKATGRIKEKQIADKQVMTVRTATGTAEQPVSEAQRSVPSLSDAQIATLTDLARRIEAHAGQPMDVEWAVCGGELFVLQARPITALPPAPSISSRQALSGVEGPVEGSVPEAPDLLGMEWSRQMLIERYPDPITPFTWSVMDATLFSSFETTFRILGGRVPQGAPLIRLIYGRPYINVTLLNRGFEALPFRPPVASTRPSNARTEPSRSGRARPFDRPVGKLRGGLRTLPPLAGPGALLVLGRVLNLVRTTHREWERLLPPFVATVRQESTRTWETLPTAEILEGIARQEVQAAALLANHSASIIAAEISLQMLQGLTRAWLGDVDGRLATTLLSGLTGNVTVETNRALWRLAASGRNNGDLSAALRSFDRAQDRLSSGRGSGGAVSLPKGQALRQGTTAAGDYDWRNRLAGIPGGPEFLASLDTFLQTYGHRSPCYEFSHPTWRERPEQVLALIRLYLDGSVADPGEAQARKAAEREAATHSARRHLPPPKRFIFDRVLALAQTYFCLRENQQFYLVLGLPMLRRILLTLGRRLCEAGMLREPDDVFFLENLEVRALAAQLAGLPAGETAAPADPVRLVAERRDEFEQHCALVAPIHLGGEASERT